LTPRLLGLARPSVAADSDWDRDAQRLVAPDIEKAVKDKNKKELVNFYSKTTSKLIHLTFINTIIRIGAKKYENE
jgi:hypothetical protein